jgi:glycosyltransferase involved in cell wall biosynthesis
MELETRISVVVVTYNRPDEVKKAINSLLHQSVKPFEIIVIDDASSSPLQMKIEDSRIKLIRFNEERGLSGARNYGISASKGNYLAFMDDDCIANKYWLEEIQKGIKAGGDILGGPLRPRFRAKPPLWWDEYDLGYFAGVGNSKNHAIWGANMIFRKEVFRKIGVFNPKIGRQKGKLLACEDACLISRGRDHYKVLFMPKAEVYHLVRAERLTLRYIIRWSYYSGKSQKIASGPNKLAIYFFLRALMELANPFSSAKKSAKIEKVARMVELFGAVV